MIFEGTEKKFELILTPESDSLRTHFSIEYWKKIVNLSKASILSSISNNQCDAYLLSESSLFIFDHKVIMITCGRTLLIDALLQILKDVPEHFIHSLFYERKNENFPHLQPTQFREDIEELQKVIPGQYKIFGLENGHHVSIFYTEKFKNNTPNDQTLEILMYDIDKKIKPLFHTEFMISTSEIRKCTNIHTVLEDFIFDDFLFAPSGYSINALKDGYYFTSHITPNDIGSYVSFETNFPFQSQNEIESITHKIVSFFQPKKFDLIYFKDSHKMNAQIKNYSHDFDESVPLSCGYEVSFQHFSQKVQSLTLAKPPQNTNETSEASQAKRK